MEYLAKYITKQNIIRAAVFSVLTPGVACCLFVLAKYLNGGAFSVTRTVIGTAAAAAFCFLATLTVLTAARMDLIQEESERAKKIRDGIILLCCLCLGLLVYLDWISFYCLLPLVLLLFTTKNSNFKVALLMLFCLFVTGFSILMQ